MRTISDYHAAYDSGADLKGTLRQVWERIQEDPDDGIFIYKFSWEEIVAQIPKDLNLALCGIPYVVKDNIDYAGVPTTAACPDFSYVPEEDATVIAHLKKAGAVCFGKTNLDQFATGLVGVRTPYPVPKNPFDEEYLPGGSSCGSAVAVAKELVVFSLGTDTAGSGRVPAAFNELVGLKPTRGYLSTRGVVDACKSLDCVSIFTSEPFDAAAVLEVTAEKDAQEAWSREVARPWARLPTKFVFGVPRAEDLHFFGWYEAHELFEEASRKFELLGGTREIVSLEPFMKAARLLYEGPWVTERYVAIEKLLTQSPESLLPVTREIIEAGKLPGASELFKAQYDLADCKRLADQTMERLDFVMLPTVPRNYKVSEVALEPIKLNSILGTYTNFMNLLDYAALALPAGRYKERLPWGVTIFSQAGSDQALLEVGAAYMERESADVEFDEIQVVVCGAHLEGMPLNWQLTERGGELARAGSTAPLYKMYLIPAGGGLPERPALVHVGADEGAALEVEVWNLSAEAFGDFVSQIPAPLGIGKVVLEDGSELPGFIAESRATTGARELTEFGGWRGYTASC